MGSSPPSPAARAAFDAIWDATDAHFGDAVATLRAVLKTGADVAELLALLESPERLTDPEGWDDDA